MKTAKKFICVIMIFCILACSAFTVSASAADNSAVARVYICSNWRKITSTPHAFIYVQNLTKHDITVGAYTCHKGEGVSVGTSALAQFNGIGVYYNLESYNGNRAGLDNCVYLERKVTQSELDKMSDFIKNANYWEAIAFNCVYFATMAWNRSGGDFIPPIDLPPHVLRLEIKAHDYGEDDLKMYYPDSSRVYKQRGMGDNARLEHVADSALNCTIG